MLKWVQSGLSAVAGTAEPEYGREAIQTITDSITKGDAEVYRDTTIADFNWQQPAYTNVETQTFYFTDLNAGWTGFAQIIHSNLMGVHTTAQFTLRIFQSNNEAAPENIWSSTKLDNFRIDGPNFYADNLSFELNAENNQYVLKSSVSPDYTVDLTVVRLVPGVIFGKDGTTFYGEDAEHPWGSMRHLFWPRCDVSGTIKSATKTFDIKGYTMFVMALQGMKPHHAAKSWNFLNFHSENYSAVQMEFTTPRSYANTKVNIGIISSNDKILHASINNIVVHKDAEIDEVGWTVPKAIEFNYIKDKQDEVASADDLVIGTVTGPLATLVERVDVMAEIPQFVKNIVSGVAGAKPYIYQYCNKFDLELTEETKKESGVGYTEVTFISE